MLRIKFNLPLINNQKIMFRIYFLLKLIQLKSLKILRIKFNLQLMNNLKITSTIYLILQ